MAGKWCILIENLDIPTLDPAMQATDLALPVTKWGTTKRGLPMPGTFHFYADDYHWTRLWYDSSKLLSTGCRVAVEPNFSTCEGMPGAEVLWGIYRKRAMARAWQQAGILTLVDLNVELKFRDLMLLGVPEGWNAYATRVHRGVPFEMIEADHALATERAGRPDPFFVVFGGGQRVQVACRARGWPWVPEHRKVVEGRVPAYGQGT